jgi:hypothetical protein
MSRTPLFLAKPKVWFSAGTSSENGFWISTAVIAAPAASIVSRWPWNILKSFSGSGTSAPFFVTAVAHVNVSGVSLTLSLTEYSVNLSG